MAGPRIMITEQEPMGRREIGPFVVERVLGRGGMGIVYLALDTRLKRRVAIKGLPQRYAADPEWRAKLTREAEILGRLNHPHIALIYERLDIEDEGSYLVLEYVEGLSLRQMLRRGPLQHVEALRVLAQVASALEAAHRRAVIHRDIKPENIQVTKEMCAKVLDFGLALAPAATVSGAQEAPGGSTLATRTAEAPAIAGTPGYMSPEQARGWLVDRRTDIFSFGCVLYESLTARRAFGGQSLRDRIVAAKEDDPDWTLLPSETPPSIRALLRQCLEKSPGERLGDVSEARRTIEEALRQPEPKPAAATPHNLPARLLSFVGRKAEVERLSTALGQCRLLSLVGPGGCGKTSLALKMAERLLCECPGGIWFIDLSEITDPSQVPQTLSAVLGVGPSGGASRLSSVRDHIRDQQILLLFDNCEHLLAGVVPAIDGLLRACPRLRVLATTRQVLGLEAEQVYFIEPLGLPGDAAESSDEELLQSEAVALFVERARLVNPAFKPGGPALAAVARICERLDGVPLAVELAAARIKMLSPQQIAGKLNNLFELLVGGSLIRPPRHRTLVAAIKWSFDLLEAEARLSLHKLEVFAGGWSLEAASAVLGMDELMTLELLTRFVDKSLVVAQAPADSLAATPDVRYRMHETIREYLRLQRSRNADSREQSQLHGVWEEARHAHAQYFSRLAKRIAGLPASHLEELNYLLLIERDNFLLARQFALQTEDPQLAGLTGLGGPTQPNSASPG